MNPFGEEEIVVIDVETTGLDPEHCGLTEIGALRVVDGEVIERYVTLVNAGLPIPFPIQRMTGITDDMIADAPSERDGLEGLLDFIDGKPLLGHNVNFDIDFITTRAVKYDLPVWSGNRIDTQVAAEVLYPRLIGYSLDELANAFGIVLENNHRAEDDAMAAFGVAQKLWQRLLSLSEGTFKTLHSLAVSSGEANLVVWTAAAEKSPLLGQLKPPEVKESSIARFDNVIGRPADPRSSQMSEDEMLAYLGPESPLKGVIEGYTVRDVQVEMAKAVHDSLEYDMFLVAEAGTGTGKSFAYLLPAIAYASRSGNKVVVSTRTKNLQEQLFFKDLPALEVVLPFDFRAVLLKGRGNYLCLHRFERLLADLSGFKYNERAALTKLIVWASETESGDLAEAGSFPLSKFPGVWAKVRSEGVACLGHRCPYNERCFVQRVRAAVVDAQVIVVNHSLLFAELPESAILGDYNHAIIDEAHNLEDVAAEYFGAQITTWDITGPLSELYVEGLKNRGYLPELIEQLSRNYELPAEFLAQYDSCLAAMTDLQRRTEAVFTLLTNRLETAYSWRDAPYSLKQRYHPGEQVFEGVGGDLLDLAKTATKVVDRLGMLLAGMPDVDDESLERLSREVAGQLEKLSAVADALTFMCDPSDINAVYWWESPPRQDSIDSKVCWAPLDIANRMFKVFHTQKKSAVFTSATMSVAGDFGYILGRLGLDLLDPERVITIELGSPYDFPSQLLVLFPDFLPEPNIPAYYPAIAELVSHISSETKAGILALFTSYRALQQVYGITAPTLAEHGTLVLAQGISGGRSYLTRQFMEDKESVLLGTESFWQGVDIRGEALQVLFLTKLPFAVPTDPYVAGQCERMQRLGYDPFSNYTVPQAVIKFRQGIGRLIRGEEDIGVLILCDRRIGTRAYGRAFIESLPVGVERVYSPFELVSKLKRFI